MTGERWALLVYEGEEPIRGLGQMLVDQGITTRHVRHCSVAQAAIRHIDAPVLVLTGTCLSDGTWADVLKAAGTAPESPPVIVLSRHPDIELYLGVMECGAYDFLAPPLSSAHLANIVNGAIRNGVHGTLDKAD